MYIFIKILRIDREGPKRIGKAVVGSVEAVNLVLLVTNYQGKGNYY